MAHLRPTPNAAPPAQHFDELYRRSDDPWAMRERWYEARKRALTLAALPKPMYEAGFEPGCANGELSAALAPRCKTLLASDMNHQAVALATQRLRACANVRVEQRTMPQDWPPGEFDLLVISELAYYLSPGDLETLITRALASLTRTGTLLACHWRHSVEAFGQTAQRVHATIGARPGLTRLARHIEADFLLDVWSPDARSVAQHEGVI
jgi:hypothetical protein